MLELEKKKRDKATVTVEEKKSPEFLKTCKESEYPKPSAFIQMPQLKNYLSSYLVTSERFETKKFYKNLTCRPPQKFASLSSMKDNFCTSELKAKKAYFAVALLVSSWWICTLAYAPSQF